MTIQWTFLPSLTLTGPVISEDWNEKAYGWQRIQSDNTSHGTFGPVC